LGGAAPRASPRPPDGDPAGARLERTALTAARQAPRAGLVLLGLVFLGFVSLGLPDGLLGVAWPSIRQSFGLPLDALGWLLFTAAGGYLAASLASGWVVARLGVGRLLALSSLATAVALLGYALAPVWAVLVLLGVLAGLGAGAIDAGLNAYVALNHSPRLLNWLHASFGLGAAAGPAIMTAVLQAGQPWRLGYTLVGLGQAALFAGFLATAHRWPGPERTPAPPAGQRSSATAGRTWRLPLVWLSIALFLVYTGLETAAGQWAYSLFTESRQAPPALAGLWVSLYWANLAVGRLLFGLVVNRTSPAGLLRGCLLAILLGTVLLWLDPSPLLSFAGLGLIGFAAAPIFPSLIAQTPRRIGPEHAAHLIGFQVGAASLGIALLPALAGVLAEQHGLEIIPPLLTLAALAMLALHEAVVRATG
jgi:fucose permease